MTDTPDALDGKGFDFKHGYHTAMREIAEKCLRIAEDEEKGLVRPQGFFTLYLGMSRTAMEHHGAARVARRIVTHTVVRANKAFNERDS